MALFGEGLDLGCGAVHQDDADIERAQDRDIQEDVGKIFVSDNAAIDADDKNLFAELRDVLQDAAQVGQFHVWLMRSVQISESTYSVLGAIQIKFLRLARQR